MHSLRYILVMSMLFACGPAASPNLHTTSVQLVPKKGGLQNMLFVSADVNIRPRLYYSIKIPVIPFDANGEKQKTLLSLDFIEFDRVSNWRDLIGKEFVFAQNPKSGYIDSSIYLNHFHNLAYVSRIRFGALKGNLLSAELDVQFESAFEDSEGPGQLRSTWNVELEFDPIALDSIVREAKKSVVSSAAEVGSD